MQKPAIPKGTRDFGPEQMIKRTYILDTIREVYKRYGFLPLETPSMELLSVLTGKYGDEGDQLIFKILRNGDFLSRVKLPQDKPLPTSVPLSWEQLGLSSKDALPQLSEKALRYDLTVPFARFVAMNHGTLSFPFKRYQIQPVWRGDRPQKGRYQEFYQCDADVVGTDSLVCEADIVGMVNDVFDGLGLTDFSLKINNRKVLIGLVETIGAAGKDAAFCVAIDKLDKIGLDKVEEELAKQGFDAQSIAALRPIMSFEGSFREKVAHFKQFMTGSAIGLQGLEELEQIIHYLDLAQTDTSRLDFDITLARGLSYYTGAIFEVKANHVSIGSISGGGRYDNLTGVFGLKDVSGVGISFGVDRIYDVISELELFPDTSTESTSVLVGHFDQESLDYGTGLVARLRRAGIRSELYPDLAKMKKQLSYANRKSIPFAILIGSNEMESGQLTLKYMQSGEQLQSDEQGIITAIKKTLVQQTHDPSL